MLYFYVLGAKVDGAAVVTTEMSLQQQQQQPSSSAFPPDTLDSLLKFLKVPPASPVSGVMELRSLLMAEKEEKILLRSLVDQMRVDLHGIR